MIPQPVTHSPFQEFMRDEGTTLPFAERIGDENGLKETVLLPSGLYIVQSGLLFDRAMSEEAKTLVERVDLEKTPENEAIIPPKVLGRAMFAYGKGDIIYLLKGSAMQVSKYIPTVTNVIRPKARGKVELSHFLTAEEPTQLSYLSPERLASLAQSRPKYGVVELIDEESSAKGTILSDILSEYARQLQKRIDYRDVLAFTTGKLTPLKEQQKRAPPHSLSIETKNRYKVSYVLDHLIDKTGTVEEREVDGKVQKVLTLKISQNDLSGLMNIDRSTLSRILRKQYGNLIKAQNYDNDHGGRSRGHIITQAGYAQMPKQATILNDIK